MNFCAFIGNTTKDIELVQTQNGKTYAKFSLAVDTGIGKNKKTSFLPMTVWGKSAEAMEKYVPKGTKIAVQSEAQQNTYTNKNGDKVNSIDFIVHSWEFAQKKNEMPENESTADTSAQVPDDNGFLNIPDNINDDELPFA